MEVLQIEDWGELDYMKAWERQQLLFREAIERKKAGQRVQNRLVFVEHPHVYTLGKHGKVSNLLISEAFLKQINAAFYRVDRGGDITYHGPGQLVGYPIIDLEALGLSIKGYISAIEEAIIAFLKEEYNIIARTILKAPGVWLGKDAKKRKICAIGAKASHYLTMHGFALNVSTDLTYFSYINPCGLETKGVTSIVQETGGEKESLCLVKKQLTPYLKAALLGSRTKT